MLLRTRRTIVVNRHQRDKLFRDYYPAATPRKIEALHSDFSKKNSKFFKTQTSGEEEFTDWWRRRRYLKRVTGQRQTQRCWHP